MRAQSAPAGKQNSSRVFWGGAVGYAKRFQRICPTVRIKARLLFRTSHRDPNQVRQPAYLSAIDVTMALNWFLKFGPPYRADTSRLCQTILAESRFACPQQQICRPGFVNRGGERDHQNRGRPRVAVAPIGRHNYHWPPAFIGRVGREMCPPNLSSQRIAHLSRSHK
jgi:hypothetical protein